MEKSSKNLKYADLSIPRIPFQGSYLKTVGFSIGDNLHIECAKKQTELY